jgi:predicted NAD-dependent protein-ADP-ribosyltransferase YbiA (DUF1768 family)
MERNGEKAEKEESSRSGARSAGRFGLQRSQEASEQRKRPQGRPSQEPQKNSGRETQRTPAKAWSPQRLNLLIEAMRARFGECAIGRGDDGVHFSGGR